MQEIVQKNRNGNENRKPEIVVVPDMLGMQIRGILKIKDGKSFVEVKEMITHPAPDLDALAWYLVGTYCGVSMPKPKFEAMSSNGYVRGRTATELLGQGIITVDTCGGQFDHHPAENFPNECATSLFYEVIPTEMKFEAMDKFVKFVTDRDTKRTQYPLDLSHICKILATNNDPQHVLAYMYEAFEAYMGLYLYDEKDKAREELNKRKTLLLSIFKDFSRNEKRKIPEIVQKYMRQVKDDKTSNIPDLLRITTSRTRDIVILILEELYQNQCEFDEAVEILKSTPRVPLGVDLQMTVKGGRDKEFGDRFLTYVYNKKDNRQIVRAALYEGFSVVVVKNSKGQTQIFSQANHFIPMEDIARAIFYEEFALVGDEIMARSKWYYHKEAHSLLNGSFTTPNQTPTVISLEKIANIIEDVCRVNNGYLPFCKGGKLACSPKCRCYRLMTMKCQQIRANQKRPDKMDEVIIIACPDPRVGTSTLKRRPETTRINLKK